MKIENLVTYVWCRAVGSEVGRSTTKRRPNPGASNPLKSESWAPVSGARVAKPPNSLTMTLHEVQIGGEKLNPDTSEPQDQHLEHKILQKITPKIFLDLRRAESLIS
ncbi:hypothetical protein N24_2707 [Corynebacterium suranareeae]|uniref:Uncharacterized protein n=1 Tax=Corynebacterium suranareeae TaxID=2506452 RepID=A0A160PS48_9CORY|nr:hypothetical protein N24_2707 [Corynebacterium suranareeae]